MMYIYYMLFLVLILIGL